MATNMSLVQRINRKRPRAFRSNTSDTSSPRNSSTPILRSTTAALTSNGTVMNPFLKSGFDSNDPICLDSESESDGQGENDEDYFLTVRNQLGAHGGYQDSVSPSNAVSSGEQSTKDSDSAADERKLTNPFFAENVFEEGNVFEEASILDSGYYKPGLYFSDTGYNEELYLRNYDKDDRFDGDLIFKKQKQSLTIRAPQVSYCLVDYEPFNTVFPKPLNISVPVVPTLRGKTNCDESNGHYKVQLGKTYANDRFSIKKLLGQGTFGKVISAYDDKTKNQVAIKIIKAVPKYREAAKIELRILSTLKQFDPTNSYNCIHLNEAFDYKNHVSFVTDLLSLSIYDFFNKNDFKSFPGSHIQSFAKQLLKSVVFLHDLNIIHTDLKPENVLLLSTRNTKKYYHGSEKSSKKSTRKSQRKASDSSSTSSGEDGTQKTYRRVLSDTKINLIDFGSAVFNDEYHPSLVSTRHYRAPEISFGNGWSFECDLWSVGCILIELLIGEALFNTHDNCEHLLMMEKITNQRLDLRIIRDSCVHQNDLNDLRIQKKPYDLYGNHYVISENSAPVRKENNGYGSIPGKFDVANVNPEVYKFLEERGPTYFSLSDVETSPGPAKVKRGRNKSMKYIPTGQRPLKQKLPKDITTKSKKLLSDLAPIEVLVSDKIGIYIDSTLSLQEAYFKYCLQFGHDSGKDELLKLVHGCVTEEDYQTEDGVLYQNLDSIAGGLINNRWATTSPINFLSELKRGFEVKNPSLKSSLDNLVLERIGTKSSKVSIIKPYPQELLDTRQRYINGADSVIQKLYGPVDFETFQFWYNYIDLLKRLLVFEPCKRLTAYEALNHEWFNNGIYDDGVSTV